jgi:serine/threonine protein kinase
MKTIMMIGLTLTSHLEYLHFKQYVHRDLKPKNILIGSPSKENKLYLIDFGLVKKYVD